MIYHLTASLDFFAFAFSFVGGKCFLLFVASSLCSPPASAQQPQCVAAALGCQWQKSPCLPVYGLCLLCTALSRAVGAGVAENMAFQCSGEQSVKKNVGMRRGEVGSVSAISQAWETWGVVQSVQRKLSMTHRCKAHGKDLSWAGFLTCALIVFYSPVVLNMENDEHMMRHNSNRKKWLSLGVECRKLGLQGDGDSLRIWIDSDGLLHTAEDCCLKIIFFISHNSSPPYKKKDNV